MGAVAAANKALGERLVRSEAAAAEAKRQLDVVATASRDSASVSSDAPASTSVSPADALLVDCRHDDGGAAPITDGENDAGGDGGGKRELEDDGFVQEVVDGFDTIVEEDEVDGAEKEEDAWEDLRRSRGDEGWGSRGGGGVGGDSATRFGSSSMR